MKILNKIVDTFLMVMMVCSAFILAALTFAQVISRFVFHIPIPWSTDVIRICFVYSIFLGASYAAKNNEHLNLDVVLGMLKPKLRLATELLIFAVLSFFCAFIAYVGWQFTIGSGLKQNLPYLTVPMAVMYVSIPTGGVIMTFYYLQNAVKTARQLFAGDAEMGS